VVQDLSSSSSGSGLLTIFHSAAKRSLRERFAANLILAPIFFETLTASAFQKKSAQFSQKSSQDSELNKTELFLREARRVRRTQKKHKKVIG
jgi:hypothetical protein